jgi:hypothetical protein
LDASTTQCINASFIPPGQSPGNLVQNELQNPSIPNVDQFASPATRSSMNNVIRVPLSLSTPTMNCFASQPSMITIDASNGAPTKFSHPNQPNSQPAHSPPSDRPVYRLSSLSIPVPSKDWSYHQPSGDGATIIRKGTASEDIVPRGPNSRTSGFSQTGRRHTTAVEAPQFSHGHPSKLSTFSSKWYS